jgi:hypothetical protein
LSAVEYFAQRGFKVVQNSSNTAQIVSQIAKEVKTFYATGKMCNDYCLYFTVHYHKIITDCPITLRVAAVVTNMALFYVEAQLWEL